MLSVIRPGPLTTLQDTGRPGSAHLGIGRSGGADVPALRLANALVGNPARACVLEMTLAGPTLSFDADTCVALTGAPMPKARVGDATLPMWQSVRVAAGTRVVLGPMATGCRSYLAVAGGIAVRRWRGSRATDVNAGLGPIPRALQAGDTLETGSVTVRATADDIPWSLDPRPWFDASTPCRVRVLPGSHSDRLDAASREALAGGTFCVGNDSNRVGIRLDGPDLALIEPQDIISEGVVAGTIQLPADGRAIIMGCEHPVTGGYPRIGQVAAVDLPVLAQCRPGDTVTFEWIDEAQALRLLAAREAALQRLVADIHARREDP